MTTTEPSAADATATATAQTPPPHPETPTQITEATQKTALSERNTAETNADSKSQKQEDATVATSSGGPPAAAPPAPSSQGAESIKRDASIDIEASKPADFEGEIATNNEIPSVELLRKLENYTVLDRHGKTHPFKTLYKGGNAARRVLVIFVRHFFCGNCQEYLRTLSESITTEALLNLPVSTFITVIGCGDPGLIQMYADATNCPFPIYTDPTSRLFRKLGMTRTWELGAKPAYMRKSMLKSATQSVLQGLKQIPSGLATKSGDQKQVGGEFLFEPSDVATPIHVLDAEQINKSLDKAIAQQEQQKQQAGEGNTATATPGRKSASVKSGRISSSTGGQAGGLSIDGDEENDPDVVEEKHITWCHRMKTTRDHAEIPELMEVLGLDGNGKPTKNLKLWAKAIQQRKGTGFSMASQMSELSQQKQQTRRMDLPA